jgi:hypothetical protein
MKSIDKLVQVANTMSAKPVEFKVGDLVVCSSGMSNTHQLQYGVVYAVVEPVTQPNMPFEQQRGFRPRAGFSYNPHEDRALVPTVILASFEPDAITQSYASAAIFVTDAYRMRMATLTDVNRYNRHIQRLLDLEEERKRVISEFCAQVAPFQDGEIDEQRPTTTL